MALINCPECGKEISDKATTCPNCGNPIAQQVVAPQQEEYMCCPKCRSKELHSQHKGFSGGKALAGAVLTGGIGLLAGTIGSKDVQITCLKCGNQFKAGEAVIVKNNGADLDSELIEIIKTQGKVQAAARYINATNVDAAESLRYVGSLMSVHNIEEPPQQVSAIGIVISVIVGLAVAAILITTCS